MSGKCMSLIQHRLLCKRYNLLCYYFLSTLRLCCIHPLWPLSGPLAMYVECYGLSVECFSLVDDPLFLTFVGTYFIFSIKDMSKVRPYLPPLCVGKRFLVVPGCSYWGTTNYNVLCFVNHHLQVLFAWTRGKAVITRYILTVLDFNVLTVTG